MALRTIYPQKHLLTANGTVDGVVPIDDVSQLAVGAVGMIYDSDTNPISIVVNAIDALLNTITLFSGGMPLDATQFKQASAAMVDFPLQQVYGTSPVPPGYVLPTASPTTLGGVKVGYGLDVDVNGVLSDTVPALDLGTVSGNVTVDVSAADFISMTLTGAATSLSFTGGPSANKSKQTTLRLQNASASNQTSIAVGLSTTVSCQWDGNQFILFGASQIATSPDGVYWTTISAPTLGSPTKVLLINGNYIALYNSGTGTYVLKTSTDGINWTGRVRASVSCYDCYWDGTQYIIIMNGGGLATSPDLITWTAVSAQFTTYSPLAIAYNGTTYVVACQSSGNIISASSLSGPWTIRSTGQATNWNHVIYANGMFMAAGTAGKLISSADGITWNPVMTQGGQNHNRIHYLNGLWMTNTANTAATYTSTDGVNWNARTLPGNNMAWTAFSPTLGYITSGSNSTATSPDGITWTDRSIIQPTSMRLVPLGGIYLGYPTGSGITAVCYSTDGIAWRRVNHTVVCSQINTVPQALIAWNGTTYVVVGYTSSPVVSSSPDGLTWTHRTTIGSAGSPQQIIWTGNKFAMVSNQFSATAGPTLHTSDDGFSWTNTSLFSFGLIGQSANPVSLASNGTRLVIALNTGSVLVTDNYGVTGTLVDVGQSSTSLGAIYWSGTEFVVSGSNGFLATSPDGFTWTQRQQSAFTSLGAVSGFTGTHHYFSSNGTTSLYLTTDWVNWRKRTGPTNAVWDPARSRFYGNSGSSFFFQAGVEWGLDWPVDCKVSNTTPPTVSGYIDCFNVIYDVPTATYVVTPIATSLRTIVG